MKDRLILQRETDLEITCVKCNENRYSDFAHAASSVASTNSDRSSFHMRWRGCCGPASKGASPREIDLTGGFLKSIHTSHPLVLEICGVVSHYHCAYVACSKK